MLLKLGKSTASAHVVVSWVAYADQSGCSVMSVLSCLTLSLSSSAALAVRIMPQPPATVWSVLSRCVRLVWRHTSE